MLQICVNSSQRSVAVVLVSPTVLWHLVDNTGTNLTSSMVDIDQNSISVCYGCVSMKSRGTAAAVFDY